MARPDIPVSGHGGRVDRWVCGLLMAWAALVTISYYAVLVMKLTVLQHLFERSGL